MFVIFETVLDGPFPAIAKLVVAESGNFPELARLWGDVAIRRGMAMVQRVVERGVERGEFRAVDPQTVAPLVMAPVVMLGVWKHSFGQHTDLKVDRHAILAEHAETLLRGLALAHATPQRKGKR